jgi:hypothetical protein
MKEQQTGVDTNMRDSIPPEEKFMVTLRWEKNLTFL